MSRRLCVPASAAFLWICLAPASAAAQTATLTVSPRAVTFVGADPDAEPLLVAAPLQVTYRIQGGGSRYTWRITVLAEGDLLAGSSSVDISNVTWTATPAPPFQNGTLSRTVAQVLAAGTGQVNPAAVASLTFRLVNSWLYDAGTYTQTVVFTLSIP